MKWSSRWGAACDPCAKAKARCIRPTQQTGNNGECSRCQRLSLTCTQQVRKPRKRRGPPATSVLPGFILEQPGREYQDNTDTRCTTNSLSGDGEAFPIRGTAAASSDDTLINAGESPPSTYAAQTQVKAKPAGASSAATWLPGFHPFPTPSCTCPGEVRGKDNAEVTAESDEALLSIYRRRLSPQFPFVIVPDNLTAVELHRSRPFLAKAIMMVASLSDRRSMWRQHWLLLPQFSDAVFKSRDRSLDLLQGLIVCLGFYHYFCLIHGHFNNLSHLAVSIIADMGLDRPRIGSHLRKKYPRGIDPDEPSAMSNDERRAALAVWYISSSAAVSLKRVNAGGRHFTQHLERQLNDLRARPEYETDEVLTQLICAQRISEMIDQLHQSDQSVDVWPSSYLWSAKVDNLMADLHDSRAREVHHGAHRFLVSSHYKYGLLQLLEPRLVEADRSRNHEAVAALRHTPDYFHTSRADPASTALRDWLEEWLAIPVCHFFHMPISAYAQLTSTIVILLRRARATLINRYQLGEPCPLNTESNDNSNVSSTHVNAVGSISDELMLDLLGRLAARFEQARIEMAAAHCSEWANDYLDVVAWRLRERKACIEKWIDIVTQGAHSNALLGGAQEGVAHRPGGPSAVEGEFPPLQTLDEQTLWLNPLEQLLLDEDVFGTWM